jgi:hypothetical protein
MKANVWLCALVCTAFVTSAHAQDQGPASEHFAKVKCDAGGTEVVYKTTKVWLHMKNSDAPGLDSVECGTKVVVVRRCGLEEPTFFLSAVKMLEGRHAGETWYIHNRDLQDLGDSKPHAPSSSKRKTK